MAMRIPWDEHETAILISACADYNDGMCTKKAAIKNVSQTLRKRAENKGIEIDDVFRNENGITMQFMLVNELLTQEKCGLRRASKMFISMVELYKSDRMKFQEILMEARKTVEANKTNREEFTTWLSSRLSPAQMSEIYITYYDMDEYLQEKKILEMPVLETMNLKKIESIKNMILENGGFGFVRKSKLEKYSKAIGYYYAWLSEYYKDSDIQTMTISKDKEEVTKTQNSELKEKSLDNDIWLEETEKTKFVKFGVGETYPFTKVEYFEYFGEKHENIGSWKKLYVEVLRTLLDDYPNKINDMKGKSLGKGSRIDIGSWEDSLLMTAPRLFETNLYVETNLNATNIIDKIKHLLDLCNVDAENLVIAYSIKHSEHEKSAKKLSEKEADDMQLKNRESSYKRNDCYYPMDEAKDDDYVPLNEEGEQLALILEEYYTNGFRINSAIDRGRIKIFYNEKFSKELSLADEQIIASLKKVGVVRKDRIYAKQDYKGCDLLKQIFEDVMAVFENGASCVYPEAIYQKFHIELAEMMQIYEAEFLADTLIEMAEGKLRKKQTFLCLTDRYADLDRDVLEILKTSPVPMTYADIQAVMWYIPLDKIKHILVVTKSIVKVEEETYFYSMNLPISQEEIVEVNQLIRRALEHRAYITDVELRQLIDDHCPGIAINTAEFTTYGLRNCLGYILRDSYSFNGPIISSQGKELSMAEVFAQYCDDRDQITTEELKLLASEMNTVIYWDAVRKETIRISDELFLRYDKVDFGIDEIDNVLDVLCDKSYIPLKNIGLFMHFPVLCVPWNGYVLESYVYKYSRKFKLLHSNFSASGFFGAMVRQDSGIEDYQTLIIDVLANSNQWEDKNSALELLVEQGYQQRRKYAGIDKVVHEAKLLREKINAAKK